MILTPIDQQALPHILDVFSTGLGAHAMAQAVFQRIAATRRYFSDPTADLAAGRTKAVALAAKFNISTLDEEPTVAFSWDGHAIRTRPEGSVVFHEIAHWQNAPIERRHIYDLGLGAGPETGNVAAANAATCVDQTMKEEEENLASLLGILWEVEHDEPALMAFAEQNWLELYDRGNTHLHFVKSLDALRTRHLIDTTGHPLAASTFSFSP